MSGSKVTKFRNLLERRKGRKSQLESDLAKSKETLSNLAEQEDRIREAQLIIQQVAKTTQEQLEYRISELVSLAMIAVFEDPYEMQLMFEQRRGKTEADIVFVRDGEPINPIDAAGGGVVDIASFALRIALWSLSRPRSRNVIILDEPFKHLSESYMEKAAEMLKMISEKLKLQIIMVTHNETLTETADRVFENKIKNGVSECLKRKL